MTRMTFNEAIDFIMERLDVPQSERRSTRDKVRGRVTYNLGSGKLPRLDLTTNDIDRNELINWAKAKWPGKFNIPTNSFVHVQDSFRAGGQAEGLTLPSSIEECHAQLQKTHRALMVMRLINNSQAEHILRLKPLAEQYERICEKNSASAKKPRNP